MAKKASSNPFKDVGKKDEKKKSNPFKDVGKKDEKKQVKKAEINDEFEIKMPSFSPYKDNVLIKKWFKKWVSISQTMINMPNNNKDYYNLNTEKAIVKEALDDLKTAFNWQREDKQYKEINANFKLLNTTLENFIDHIRNAEIKGN